MRINTKTLEKKSNYHHEVVEERGFSFGATLGLGTQEDLQGFLCVDPLASLQDLCFIPRSVFTLISFWECSHLFLYVDFLWQQDSALKVHLKDNTKKKTKKRWPLPFFKLISLLMLSSCFAKRLPKNVSLQVYIHVEQHNWREQVATQVSLGWHNKQANNAALGAWSNLTVRCRQ